jgi:TPR repeat protein
MKKLSTPYGSIKWMWAVSSALLIYTTTVFAQTQPSEMGSDELMKRIVELGGKVEKKTELESYIQELMNRAKAGQPSAMFNWGWYRHQLCSTGKKQGVDVSSAPMCAQALDDLKAVAENPKISILYIAPASMSILGEMYRDGIGTKPSRYLAADWFVKSAKQRNVNGDREGAIRAMEDALNVVPDYPAAIELRALILEH